MVSILDNVLVTDMQTILNFLSRCKAWLDSIVLVVSPYQFTLWDVFMCCIEVGIAFEIIYMLWGGGLSNQIGEYD